MAHMSLLLKDYLELESSSESRRWASLQKARPFSGGETTVRCLLETELAGGTDSRCLRLLWFRSKDVLSKFFAVIRILQSSADKEHRHAVEAEGVSSLSRSFSKKLRRGFWKKMDHEKEDGKVMATAVEGAFYDEEAQSVFLFTSSPAVSKCNNSSKPRTLEFGLISSPTLTQEKGILADVVGHDSCRDQKEQCGKDIDCPSEEEKEQLSPLSVMDFPYQDEYEDGEVEQPSAKSPCFEQSVGNLERTKNQLLQKIRRLESLADVDPLNLANLFQCSDANHVAEKERWGRAACSLRRVDGADFLAGCKEKLLFDFFFEDVLYREECRPGTTSGSTGDGELLRVANGWFAGGGFKAEGYCQVGAIEKGSRGWSRFEEEKAMVAVEITDGLLLWLMAEFVVELGSAVV